MGRTKPPHEWGGTIDWLAMPIRFSMCSYFPDKRKRAWRRQALWSVSFELHEETLGLVSHDDSRHPGCAFPREITLASSPHDIAEHIRRPVKLSSSQID